MTSSPLPAAAETQLIQDPTTRMQYADTNAPAAAEAGMPSGRRARRGRLTRLWRHSSYLFVSFPLALAAFVVTVTGVTLGDGLLITVLGLPVLIMTAFLASIQRVADGGTVLDPQVVAQLMASPPSSWSVRGRWRNTPGGSSPSWGCTPTTVGTAGCGPS